jgi:hypothetical protein
MPTFERCPTEVTDLANSILVEHETHSPLLDARVKIDFVFAYSDKDDAGQPKNNALTHHGCKALGISRKIPLKDRALGRGDCEVALDGDWWVLADEKEKAALLDHEMHHFAVKIDKRGLVRDDLGRPVIQLRKHDYEFGFFNIIAQRNGEHSQERKYARNMMDAAGQYYWPEFVK